MFWNGYWDVSKKDWISIGCEKNGGIFFSWSCKTDCFIWRIQRWQIRSSIQLEKQSKYIKKANLQKSRKYYIIQKVFISWNKMKRESIKIFNIEIFVEPPKNNPNNRKACNRIDEIRSFDAGTSLTIKFQIINDSEKYPL